MRLWQNNKRRRVLAEKIANWDTLDQNIITIFGEIVSVEPGFWDGGHPRNDAYAVQDVVGNPWPVMMPAAAFEANYVLVEPVIPVQEGNELAKEAKPQGELR